MSFFKLNRGMQGNLEDALRKASEVDAKAMGTASVVSAQLGGAADEKNAEQFRFAMQKFAATLSEEEALEIATIYDPWSAAKPYKVGQYITYGMNSVGDPQLYKIVQDHTSAEEWPPDQQTSLYSPIGLDDNGHPVWSQPTGAHDAYNTGDIVNYNGTLYESLIDGNVYAPDAYPAGWKVYEEVTS